MKKAIAAGLLVLALAAPASAGQILDTDSGYGKAVASSWSRGYGHVVFYGTYHGKAHDIFTVVRCQNGFRDAHSWDDYGPRFRYVVKVPTYVRCVQRFAIMANGFVRVAIGAG